MSCREYVERKGDLAVPQYWIYNELMIEKSFMCSLPEVSKQNEFKSLKYERCDIVTGDLLFTNVHSLNSAPVGASNSSEAQHTS